MCKPDYLKTPVKLHNFWVPLAFNGQSWISVGVDFGVQLGGPYNEILPASIADIMVLDFLYNVCAGYLISTLR